MLLLLRHVIYRRYSNIRRETLGLCICLDPPPLIPKFKQLEQRTFGAPPEYAQQRSPLDPQCDRVSELFHEPSVGELPPDRNIDTVGAADVRRAARVRTTALATAVLRVAPGPFLGSTH